jgi:hypothetical protein
MLCVMPQLSRGVGQQQQQQQRRKKLQQAPPQQHRGSLDRSQAVGVKLRLSAVEQSEQALSKALLDLRTYHICTRPATVLVVCQFVL